MKGLTLSVAVLALVGMTTSVYSERISWEHRGGGNWNVASNWEPSKVPTSSDDVTITLDYEIRIPDRYDAHARNLTVSGPGSDLWIGNTGSLRIHGDLELMAGLIQTRVQSSRLVIDGDFLASGGMARLLQGNSEAIIVNGDLTATSRFRFDFNMNQMREGIRRIKVAGELSLGGAQLELREFIHNNMDRILLIHNPSEKSVTGTFSRPFGTVFDLYESRVGVGESRAYELQLVDWDGDGVSNDIALIHIP